MATTVACGKTRYDSRDEARAALAGIQRRPDVALMNYLRSGKVPSRVYRCRECGGWHLTARKEWHV